MKRCRCVTIKPAKGKSYRRKLCWGRKGITSNRRCGSGRR